MVWSGQKSCFRILCWRTGGWWSLALGMGGIAFFFVGASPAVAALPLTAGPAGDSGAAVWPQPPGRFPWPIIPPRGPRGGILGPPSLAPSHLMRSFPPKSFSWPPGCPADVVGTPHATCASLGQFLSQVSLFLLLILLGS